MSHTSTNDTVASAFQHLTTLLTEARAAKNVGNYSGSRERYREVLETLRGDGLIRLRVEQEIDLMPTHDKDWTNAEMADAVLADRKERNGLKSY